MSIIAENIIKTYKRRGKSFNAVDSVSITIPKGKITAIMGHSGSGKSTLLNILAGMIKPEKGNVLIDGTDLFQEKSKTRDKLRAGKIGIVPQSQSLIGGLTAYDNIKLQSGFSKAENDFSEIVSLLGIDDLMSAYPNNLSGGEMKRVAIARALSGNAEYIFADEPTGELDSANSKSVMEIFRKEAEKGKGILIVTHDRDAAEMADIIYHMDLGKLIS